MNPDTQRQRVLYLWLENSNLAGRVVAWSEYSGIDGGPGIQPDGRPPYATGVDALKDGWRLIQSTPVPARLPGHEFDTGRLEYEFLFERVVPLDG